MMNCFVESGSLFLLCFPCSACFGIFAYGEDKDKGKDNDNDAHFKHDNLVVSRSVYDNNPANIAVGMPLPPNCVSKCKPAISDGTYPFVWKQ